MTDGRANLIVARADSQMRQRFDQMLPICAIPSLYGLSLLGTPLRVYCGDKVTGEVTPHFVDRPDVNRILPPDFLEGQWDLDIVSGQIEEVQEILSKVEAAKVQGGDLLKQPLLFNDATFFPYSCHKLL
jgi:hypothetical protein